MPLTESAVKTAQDDPSFQDRAVPKPNLGPAGQEQAPNARIPKRAQKKGNEFFVNPAQNEDPYTLLDNVTEHQGLVDQLRDTYIHYNQIINRCQIQMKPRKHGEQFQKYYYQPKNPFLEEPEKQKVFRKNYIDEVTAMPEPEPLYLLADKLQLDATDAIADLSNPHDQRIFLGKFFIRRSAQLQHKKHKLLGRWANSTINAYQVDQISAILDRQISILQQEQDSCINRLSRLLPDDKYKGANTATRPQATTTTKIAAPTAAPEHDALNEAFSNLPQKGKQADKRSVGEDQTLLYIENKNKVINSSISQDDFEVFLRVNTFKNKTHRIAKKMMTQIKWLSYSHRFEIWKESRIKMCELKTVQQNAMKSIYDQVCEDIRKKLRIYEIIEDKAVQAVIERYTFHIKQYNTQNINRSDLQFNSNVSDSLSPPIILVGNTELKINIQLLAKEFPQVTCTQLDIDNGQKFSFSLQSFFPNKFEMQVMLMQFDIEDSGFNPDQQLIERLQNSLQISKTDLLKTISNYADKIRRNSIIGTLSANSNVHQQEENALKDSSKQLSHEEFAKMSLIKKIKTVEFFSLEEIQTKLRYADWLEYVCFSAYIPEIIKQQNCILSGKDNPIDSLLKSAIEFTDVNDSSSINKILEEVAAEHMQKIKDCQKKIKEGANPQQVIRGKEQKTTGLKESLLKATEPDKKKVGKDEYEANQSKRFAGLPDVDPLNQGLLKSFYALRLLKTRDLKIKLMQSVNYFRAVQRVLAFEMRSYVTREKALGERQDIIDPQFGKNEKGQQISSLHGATGPGKIFKNNINRDLDTRNLRADIEEPVTLKAYKYNNLFNQSISSTCPIVPKHHRTFGRPSLYEQLSQEIDRRCNPLNLKFMKDSLITKRDRIVVNRVSKEVKVLNEFGHPIFYNEALNDMLELEEEIMKIGSFYINHHEYLLASNDIVGFNTDTLDESMLSNGQFKERPSSIIDRSAIANDLYQRELDFQFEKIQLIETLLEAFEHIIDPLEAVRIMQQIVDVMAMRPRLNLESTLYKESYESEIKGLEEKRKFFSEFIALQKDIEQEQNNQVKNFQELKKRRVNEMIAGEFKYLEKKQKKEWPGSDEVFHQHDQTLEVQERIRLKLLREQQHKLGLQNIQAKHITEFANEQLTDFAQVLGLPEISMEDLAKRKDQIDPIITDSIREKSFFQKQMEGYPCFLSDTKEEGAKLGLHTEKVGLTDFYESLQIVPKINASLVQVFDELVNVNKPETGLATSTLEWELYREARLIVNQMRQLHELNGHDSLLKSQSFIEEDFFFANSDKLIFAMKEFKADLAPENLYKKANPILASKLDITVSINFQD